MPDPIRLSKRLIEITGCSRKDAEQYIEGGWVRVDGEVVDEPQFLVADQVVVLDADAKPGPTEPATLLLHKPAGLESAAAVALVTMDSHCAGDDSGVRFLRRHFSRLVPVMPLEAAASGLLVLTQDGRLVHHMGQDADRYEQEIIVEVTGSVLPYGLKRLEHGLAFQGRALPPAKASWQSENRLRLAIKGPRPGQIAAMCVEVGLQATAIKRIRIGRVPLAKMPVGEWRYLPAGLRF